MIKNLNLIKKTLFIFFLLSLIFILVYNLLHFDPILGYDAEAHYSYVDTFSRYLPKSFHIPTENESREFFSPPLPYVFPSTIQVLCRNLASNENLLEYCKPIYGKITQIFQNFLFLASILINLLTLKRFHPKKGINLSFLILTMMLAVNYRTLSIIKGEIYILFFLSILIYLFSEMEKKDFKFQKKDVIKFGLCIGLLALTRQWVFLIFPSLLVTFIRLNKNKKNYLKFSLSSLFVGFIFSSWFYFYNLFQYGSFTAFNTEVNKNLNLSRIIEFVSFENFGKYIFTTPIRPFFNNEFFPIFYSDVWGDYWGYFTFTSRFLDIGRNQLEIGNYLGRVNLTSLVTLGIVLYFYLKTIRTSNSETIIFINYSIIISFVGFFVWVLLYQTGSQGDTIKATYMTQAINLVVFGSAISIEKIKNEKIYLGVVFSLLIIFIYNFQSYLSHFPMFYPN